MGSGSEQDFINRWNKMGTHKGEGAIDGVVILAHGNENGFRMVRDKKIKFMEKELRRVLLEETIWKLRKWIILFS